MHAAISEQHATPTEPALRPMRILLESAVRSYEAGTTLPASVDQSNQNLAGRNTDECVVGCASHVSAVQQEIEGRGFSPGRHVCWFASPFVAHLYNHMNTAFFVARAKALLFSPNHKIPSCRPRTSETGRNPRYPHLKRNEPRLELLRPDIPKFGTRLSNDQFALEVFSD